MNQKELLDRLYPLIVAGLWDKDFKHIKSQSMLRKKTVFGKLEIDGYVDFIDAGYEIEILIALRIDKVEEIMRPFWDMNPAYLKERITYATSMVAFMGDTNFKLKGKQIGDIESISKEVVNFLNSEGLHHLYYYSDIVNLEDLFNNQRASQHITIKAEFSRVFYGLILAFLTGREDLDELIEKYRQEMIDSRDTQYYPERFDNLVNYIRANL